MVHRMCSSSQHLVSDLAKNIPMSPWEVIDAELKKRRLNWQWLADRLEMTIQRVQNWKKRGVPASHYRAIADALSPLTVDQIEGVSQGVTSIAGGRMAGELSAALRVFSVAAEAAGQDARDDVLVMLTLFLKNPKANAGAISLISSRLLGEPPADSGEDKRIQA